MSTVAPAKTYPNVELASCTAYSETKGYGKNKYRACILEPPFNEQILRIVAWSSSSELPNPYEFCQFTVKWKGDLKYVWLNRSSLKHRLLTDDAQVGEASKQDDLMGLINQSTFFEMSKTMKNKILGIQASPSDLPCQLSVEEVIQKWGISRRCLRDRILSNSMQNLSEICSPEKDLSQIQGHAKIWQRSHHYSAKDYNLKEAIIVTPNFIGFGQKEKLGRGRNSVVKKIRSDKGQIFARRITKINFENGAGTKNNYQTILAYQKNSGVIQLIDAYTYRSLSGTEKQVLIMEYFPMDLFSLLKEHPDKNQNQLQLIDQLLQTLSSLNGAHCDVTPENMVTDGKILKLIDFEYYTPHGPISKRRGTSAWVAPEVFNEACPLNSHKIDVWGAGLIIALLFNSRRGASDSAFFHQHPEINPREFFKRIDAQSLLYDFIDKKNQFKKLGLNLREEERNFVKKMIVVDPHQRIRIEDAAIEFRKKFLKPEPIMSSPSTGSEGSTSTASI